MAEATLKSMQEENPIYPFSYQMNQNEAQYVIYKTGFRGRPGTSPYHHK